MSLGRWASGRRMISDPGEEGTLTVGVGVVPGTWWSFMALEGGVCSSVSLGVQGRISGLLEPSWLGSIAGMEGGFQVTRYWYFFRGAPVRADPECQEERFNPGHYPCVHRIGGKI